MKDKDISSLEHTSWRCQYHIVFAPKYRRMEIYSQIKQDIGVILRKLCQQKGIEIIEARACPDHIHMLISIPPKYSVSQIMGYLKGKSSLMIFDRHANLKYKYGNRHFWARGYYVDTVGRNKKQSRVYPKPTGNRSLLTRLRVARTRRHKRNPLRGSPRKKCSRQTFRGPLRGFVRIRPL